MLIIVPSSEGKRPAPARGRPVDLGALSFPALGPVRARVLEALVATSGAPDALDRLGVAEGLAHEVALNLRLRSLAARPVLEVYDGVVHEGLGWAGLSPAARRRAARRVVVASALWGLLRPADRIPPYRLSIDARLLGLGVLAAAWAPALPAALAEAAGPRGPILDLRAAGYQAAGLPAGMAHRTATLAVEAADGTGRPGNVIVKRMRGQAARHLLEASADPRDLRGLTAVLGERWPARLEAPARPGRPWTLVLRADP